MIGDGKEDETMSAVLGNLAVISVLAGAVGLAVRSLRNASKAGGPCTGDCASCGRKQGGCGAK